MWPRQGLLTWGLLPQDCAGVILYSAECATQVALDGIQCFGEWPPRPTPLPRACLWLPPERGFLFTAPSELQLAAAELLLFGCLCPSCYENKEKQMRKLLEAAHPPHT